jgi:hypothetical protein
MLWFIFKTVNHSFRTTAVSYIEFAMQFSRTSLILFEIFL